MKIKLEIKNNDLICYNYIIDDHLFPKSLKIYPIGNAFINASTIVFTLEMFIVNPFNFK